MKRQILITAGVFVVATIFSGCATIMSGKTQTVKFVSDQPVNVSVDGKNVVAPATVEVKRENASKIVRVECNGKSKQIVLKKKVNPWFGGNLIIGGPLGSTTDYVSDAMWQYDDTVDVNCR